MGSFIIDSEKTKWKSVKQQLDGKKAKTALQLLVTFTVKHWKWWLSEI